MFGDGPFPATVTGDRKAEEGMTSNPQATAILRSNDVQRRHQLEGMLYDLA